MARDNYEKTILVLRNKVVEMMDISSEILDESIRSFVEKDIEAAKLITNQDDAVDDLLNQVEDICTELIALQQPTAKDMRIVFSIIKMVTDIERIGDYCVNISREVIVIGDEPHYMEVKDVLKMRDIIQGMLADTRKSFIEGDAYLALKVGKQDDLVDEIYRDFYNDVLLKISDNREFIRQGTKLLFIGRHLERIADHITNICEKVVYIMRGERIQIN